MGVKNLWDILESCKKTLPLHHLRNKRVCVDLSCWVVQLQNVYRSHCPMKEKLFLKGLFHRLRALIALNCSIIFVTDGSIPGIKLSAYRRRLNAGNDVILDAKHPRNVLSLKRNMGSEFSCMIKEAKLLGMALGIQCLDGIEEAEAQCALLNAESLCDGCFTADSDAFLFGARTVYRDICLEKGGHVICYEMDDIERELGFGRDSLIALAILLGSDYSQGIRGIGPESACQLVRATGDSSVLRRLASEGLSFAKKPKNLIKKGKNLESDNKENYVDSMRDVNGKKCNLPIENQFLKVINAYLKPKCHSADSDAVHRALALYHINRSQLHQICSQYFDWPPIKTDEYILPKIAERNLRRFANLRSTSSELEVHLPINEMPVKCPVSTIVKQRKILGSDYYEVSWEDMDGLEVSVVPANLVESACPEKIVEFQQLKAQKQKPARKPRQKKQQDMREDMREIERKLQELLNDIENEGNSSTHVVSPRGIVPDTERIPAGHVGVIEQQRTHLDTGSKEGKMSKVYSATADIIDLISPPPPPRAHTREREVLKSRELRCTDVIELSDTDNDVSPEHARKVRELRLFMATVIDDDVS